MSATTTHRIDDATPVQAATDWKMATLAIAAAAGMVWWFKLPLDFESRIAQNVAIIFEQNLHGFLLSDGPSPSCQRHFF